MNKSKAQEPGTEDSAVLAALGQKLAAQAHEQALVDVAYRIVDSPLGSLLLASTQNGLARVAFESEDHDRILELLSEKLGSRITRNAKRLDAAARQLDEYFSGQRQGFELALDLTLSTDFRRQVQLQLGQIAYGQTWQLRPDGAADRQAQSRACRWLSLRHQPDSHRAALPPGAAHRWVAGRLPRRA